MLGIDDTKLTRVTLVDESGVVFERYGLSVEMMLQDEDRTLKVFVKSDNPEAEAEARANFVRDLEQRSNYAVGDVDKTSAS